MDIYLHSSVKLRLRVLGYACSLENSICLQARENYSCEKSSARQEKKCSEHVLRGDGCLISCQWKRMLVEIGGILGVWFFPEQGKMTPAHDISAFMSKRQNAVCANG